MGMDLNVVLQSMQEQQVSISYMAMELVELQRMMFQCQQKVSISYMGMEPTDTYKEVEAEVTYMYQSPIWVWNKWLA